MQVSEFGRLMFARLEQSSKQFLPKYVTVLGNITVSSASHPAKQLSQIESVFDGIVIDLRLLQPENVELFSDTSPSESTTDSRS